MGWQIPQILARFKLGIRFRLENFNEEAILKTNGLGDKNWTAEIEDPTTLRDHEPEGGRIY